MSLGFMDLKNIMIESLENPDMKKLLPDDIKNKTFATHNGSSILILINHFSYWIHNNMYKFCDCNACESAREFMNSTDTKEDS